jgi:hypothetical protein
MVVPPAPVPPPAPPPPLLLARESQSPGRPPVYRRWWLWAGIGAAVAAVGVVAVLVTRQESPQGSLATIDGR